MTPAAMKTASLYSLTHTKPGTAATRVDKAAPAPSATSRAGSAQQISVPELGTIKAKHQPIVLLTSNNTRELSEALKRRCLYIHIDYPSQDAELQIVNLKVPGLSPRLAQQAVELVQRLRGMDLKKHPSVSETIDWARALVELNAKHLDRATIDTTLSVLLKYESDITKARRALGREENRGNRGN